MQSQAWSQIASNGFSAEIPACSPVMAFHAPNPGFCPEAGGEGGADATHTTSGDDDAAGCSAACAAALQRCWSELEARICSFPTAYLRHSVFLCPYVYF